MKIQIISNYGRESLLEVIRQNIAGCCRQTFENKDIAKSMEVKHIQNQSYCFRQNQQKNTLKT